MAVALTQVITEDRASGAQVIDGSLKFDGSSTLTRTSGSAGNQKTWTFSVWIKRLTFGASQGIFCPVLGGDNTNESQIRFYLDDRIQIYDSGGSPDKVNILPTQKFRDPSAWYHIVIACDTTQSTAADRMKFYVNGTQIEDFDTTQWPDLNEDLGWNNTSRHDIGRYAAGSSAYFPGHMSNFYWIDGQQLDASYFGFTDGLTNTWRPKKYTGTYGTNGFYLPMDGNSLIGEDKSGNGNDFTPVNFGGSNTIEKATGALPILNTANGGNVAVPGVFGSKVSNNYTVSSSSGGGSPYIFDNAGTQPTFSFIRGATYTFDYSNATSHPLRFSTTSNGTHGGGSEYTDGTTTSGNIHKITVPHNAPDTLYYYCTAHSGMGNSISVTTDEKVADPYAWKCVFAVPTLSDVSGDLNTTTSNKTVTNNNSVSNSNISNFYTSGAYVKGSNRHLSTANNSDFNLGSDDFTWEMWVYPTASGNTILSRWGETGQSTGSWAITNGGDVYLTSNGSTITQISFTAASQNKWTHLAVVRSGSGSNNIKIYKDGILSTTGTFTGSLHQNNLGILVGNYSAPNNTGTYAFDGYIQDVRVYKGVAKYTSNFIPASTNPDILPDTPSGVAGGSALTSIPDSATEGAVVFDGSDDYLSIGSSNDFEFGSGDFTVEFWFKSTKSSAAYQLLASRDMWSGGGGGTPWFIQLTNSDTLVISGTEEPNPGAWSFSNQCSVSVARGVWNHVAFTRNGNTLNLYANGIKSADYTFNFSFEASSNDFIIGKYASGQYFEGYISNFRVIKGTALYTANFAPPTAPLTNVTNTKLLCCQSTTSATTATVSPTSITANGSVASKYSPFMPDNINTVRGQESGYATYLPFGNDQTYHNGNLQLKTISPGYGRITLANIAIPNGEKFFVEYTVTDTGASNDVAFGVDNGNSWSIYNYASNGSSTSLDADYRAYRSGGGTFVGSTYTSGTPGKAISDGDVIGTAIDRVNNEISYYKNGIKVYTHSIASSPSTGNYYPSVGTFTGTADVTINAGQKPFKYAPPEGFKTLCLANLPRPTEAAVRPDKYFNTVLYTGNATGRTITGVGFQADFLWNKLLDTGAQDHLLYDTVRGIGSNGNYVRVRSNTATAEEDPATANQDLTAFTSDGFTIGTHGALNGNNQSYVTWLWKAGGAAVSNTDGSITSSVSANQDSGFSIATYTGNGSTGTVGHGLNAVPKMILCKNRNNSGNWFVYHTSLDSGKALQLNTTLQAYNASPAGINAVSSSTFTLGGARDETNTNGGTYVAYSWTEVPGFSKFGSYTGNGSADGPFIYLGFKPAWLLLKRIDSTSSWFMLDTTRDTYNVSENYLIADGTNTEATYTSVDFLSNGFKPRNSSSSFNTSGATHIYAAFAEAPTNNLFGGQANAR